MTIYTTGLELAALQPTLTLEAGTSLVEHGTGPRHQSSGTTGGEVSVVRGEAAGAGAGEEGEAPTVESHSLVTQSLALSTIIC